MMGDTAKRVVEAVHNELYGRGGFDGWWGAIEADIQDEILDALETRVRAILGDRA